jgi:hypothetical protein
LGSYSSNSATLKEYGTDARNCNSKETLKMASLFGQQLGLSGSTFTNAGGAVADLFAAVGDKAKAKYDFAEASNYGLASDLATQNEKFTETSTAIKEAQQSRESSMLLGGQQADVANAGFSESGSSLDLLRDSAAQGALTHAVLGQQGLITEAGYQEQAASYKTMQGAANDAGNAANQASTFADVTGVIKGVAAVASLFTGVGEVAGVAAVGGAAASAVGDAKGIGGLY